MSVLLCTSCSIFPAPGEPPVRYTLEKINSSQNVPRIKEPCSKPFQHLGIDLPIAHAPYDSQRIAVMPRQNQIDYYAGIEWIDHLPTLIQESLIHSLQDIQTFDSITRTTKNVTPDRILKIDIREFYIDKTKRPVGAVGLASVEYFVSIVNPDTHQTLSKRIFHKSLPLPNEKKQMIALTLNKANQAVLLEIFQWIDDLS
jgi:ABC-type uncharacterized transport system auxiliary subunit